MRKFRHSTSPRFLLKPLALAAAMLLAPPAMAQISESGANSISPAFNLLPIAGAPMSLDFTGNRLYVGAGGVGSFSILAGAVLSVDSLALATGSSDTGTFTVSGSSPATGARSRLLLGGGGEVNRLEIGNWGTGTLTVSGGALVDATVNAGSCTVASWCYTFIGNGAGSTGTLIIEGAGSEVRTLRSFIVGQTAVFTNPPSTGDFGTPGGATTALVEVKAGGTLRTEGATIASNNGSPDGNGSETVNATVTVDGAGSQWIVTRNSIDNTAATMSIGTGAGSNGVVTVSAGGKLHIDGTGSVGPNDGVGIGSNGKGKLTVTGAGSQVLTSGVNPFINVGASGPLSNGTFEVLAGATASTLYLNVGRDGGTGTMLIDGLGSKLTQSGVGVNQAPATNGPAFAHIGRNRGNGGGNGSVEVRNGGQWIIDDGGGDGRTSTNSPGFALGRGADSTGSLTITGAGSRVEISSTSLNPGAGVGDNYNPFVAVGYDNPDTTSGTLTISAGGKLILNGNAVSAPNPPSPGASLSRATGINIGGRSGAAGTGTATVTGLGSEIQINGYDAYINVGRTDGSTGTLNVEDQALVTSTSLAVGIGTTTPGTGLAQGTVNIDNAKLLLTGRRTDTDPLVGAGSTIGRGVNGVGVLNISKGGQLEISSVSSGGGMSIGGDQFLGGGSGTATLTGGSSIVHGGALTGMGINIGWSGTGVVNLSGGSFINVGTTGSVTLAGVPTAGQSTGNGTLTLASGSKVTANSIHVGGNSDLAGTPGIGGTGSAAVTGLGSELKASGAAGFIGVGRGGNGTLTVADQGKVSAIGLAVGRNNGVGQLLAQNATIELSGQQTTGSALTAGAFLAVGTGGDGPDGPNRPGTGIVTLVDSTVTISNAGSLGASVSVGGSGNFPGGTGILGLTNSQLTVNAAAGVSNISIGRTGTGVATLSASTITNTDGNVFVGREVGSSGTLILSNGSVLNAAYVGAGTSQPYDGNAYNGGSGVIVLNDSTINTGVFELGAGGVLTGNNGTLDAVGDVIIGGTVSPGESPGRLRILCNVIMVAGSKIIIEISGSAGNYQADQLIIGEDAAFDLASAEIVFSFLGDTDPNEVSAVGGLNLDNFLRTAVESAPIDGPTQALSTQFQAGQTWSDVVDTTLVSATSETFDVTEFKVTGDGTFALVAAPIPEPSTWGMLFVGLCAVGAVARRRRAATSAA